MKPAVKDGMFQENFSRSTDPWNTFSSRDEARKRDTIVKFLGAGSLGRALELGCGNGSNTQRIVRKARHTLAMDGSSEAVEIARAQTPPGFHAEFKVGHLPEELPHGRHEAIIIAELLYYLKKHEMRTLANAMSRVTKAGSVLILAHHHHSFHDFVQPAAGIHDRFISHMNLPMSCVRSFRTDRWVVTKYVRSR